MLNGFPCTRSSGLTDLRKLTQETSNNLLQDLAGNAFPATVVTWHCLGKLWNFFLGVVPKYQFWHIGIHMRIRNAKTTFFAGKFGPNPVGLVPYSKSGNTDKEKFKFVFGYLSNAWVSSFIIAITFALDGHGSGKRSVEDESLDDDAESVAKAMALLKKARKS